MEREGGMVSIFGFQELTSDRKNVPAIFLQIANILPTFLKNVCFKKPKKRNLTM